MGWWSDGTEGGGGAVRELNSQKEYNNGRKIFRPGSCSNCRDGKTTHNYMSRMDFYQQLTKVEFLSSFKGVGTRG